MGPQLHVRFAAAVEAAVTGATVVTSTTRASRTILAEALRRLRADKQAVRTPDVLPIGAFYQRLWSDALAAGATEQALLSDARAHALWRKLIGRSRDSLLSLHGSARIAMDAWRTAQEYRISLKKQAFRGAECEAFLEWASLYKEECRRGGWLDAASLPDALVAVLAGIHGALPKRLVVYGFEALTPQTREFLAALQKDGVAVETIGIDAQIVKDSTRRLGTANVEAELELAARWARQILKEDETRRRPGEGACATRIGVVVPRLREVQSAVEAAFAAVLHPEEFLSPAPARDRVFEIAAGQPLDEYALVRHALLALRFVFAEAPITDVGVLLRSPYFDEPETAAERALFDVELRRYGRAQYSAASLIESPGSSRIEIPQRLARRIRKMGDLRRADKALLKPSEAAELFHQTLEAANWPARELDSAEYQLREKWEDVLAEFASLDGFVPAQNASTLLDELSRMMTVAFRPENSGAPVQIMDEDEATGLAFDHLWVCGLSDEWPRRPRANPYLPLALQREAGVPDLTPEQQHASAANAIARFSASASEVVVSWAEHERDRDLRPNRLIEDFAAADAETLCGAPSPSASALQRAAVQLELLDDRRAPAANPDNLPHRGTDVLKYQAHCPFRAFAQLRLGAQKLQSPEIGVDRRVRGGLVETALQAFWTTVRNSDNLNGLLPKRDIDAALDAAVDKSFEECGTRATATWDKRLQELERKRLRALLDKWLEIERGRAAFEVMIDEQQREFEVALGPMKIRARMDRVDRVQGEGGFVVIDYKSGRTPPRPADWDSARPEEPQLPLYVVQQLDDKRRVSGVAFAHVTSANPAFKGYGRDRTVLGLKSDNLKKYLKGVPFDEHLRRWRPVLEKLATAFVEGEVAVDPKDPPAGTGNSTCDRCHVQSLCRVAEMSFATEGEDGEAGGDDE